MRLRRGCVASGLAVAVLAGCLATTAQASFPGQNGKIAFGSASAEGAGVHVVEPDGGYAQIVPTAGDPAWSADGLRLAYVREVSFGGLFVSAADGSGETLVVPVSGDFGVLNVSREPAWSPDGATIAYAAVEQNCPPRDACAEIAHGIRAVAPDGTGDHLLIDGPASDPSYSPDGTQLAWDAADGEPNPGIHVSNADGTGDTVLAEPGWEPSWSPDGSKIAFAGLDGGDREIHVMNADGTGLARLTFVPGVDAAPAWSPDGTKIAWSHANELWTMNADGTAPAPLLPAGTLGIFPDWQPLPEGAKNASHLCKALRESMGEEAFAAKYGNHGGCVSRNV